MNKSEITLPFAIINEKWSNIALWSYFTVTILVGAALQLVVLQIATKRSRNGELQR
jgi:hypothetical protein